MIKNKTLLVVTTEKQTKC